MPKVSIVIPVYNAEKYILRCMESIENQTFKDFEVIAVDDGSSDSSLKILEKFSEKTTFLKVLRQKNMGAAEARNTGIKNAAGDFICFVDSDDCLETEYLEILVKNQEETGCDISMIGINKVENEESTEIFLYSSKKICSSEKEIKMLQAGCFCNRLTDFETNFIGMGTPWDKLFRMSIIRENKILFNTSLRTGEDTYFCWEYFNFVNKFVYENKALYNYVVYSSSLSKRYLELKDFYTVSNVFYKAEKPDMEKITKDSLRYAIFRHFLSLLKKHFADRNNTLPFRLFKNELKEVLSSKELSYAKKHLAKEKFLSKKEKTVLLLSAFPYLMAAALYALNRLKKRP